MEHKNYTPGPWRFKRLDDAEKLADLQGKKLADHEGYYRENNGDWIVGFTNDAGQGRIAAVAFKGNAKRSEQYYAPDPVGMANARLIADAPALLAERDALREGYRQIRGLAFEIQNLSHMAWLDPENAELLFRKIEHRAESIHRAAAEKLEGK